MPNATMSDMTHNLAAIGIGRRYFGAELDLIQPAAAREVVRAYTADLGANLREGRGLVFTGGRGTGKSCALVVVAAAAFAAQWEVGYATSGALFDALANKHTSQPSQEWLQYLRRCPLLLCDEVGSEFGAEWPQAGFEALSELRYANMQATCVATNLTERQLLEEPRYSRAASRWRECCDWINLGNHDRRN